MYNLKNKKDSWFNLDLTGWIYSSPKKSICDIYRMLSSEKESELKNIKKKKKRGNRERKSKNREN